MDIEHVKYDCKHFRASIPCKPNKQFGVICDSCTYYTAIEKRILIIKLGALGDVIRTTPLLSKYKELYPNAHVTWLTLSPEILPDDHIDIIYSLNAASLYAIANTSYDIALNLDKEPEACFLISNVHATEKYGYVMQDGHIAPATGNAKHKLMTGFFDEYSKVNTKSYPEEIFEICGLKFNHEPYLIKLNAELHQKWSELLSSKSNGKKIIGLNTGCGPRWNTRLWDEESWINVATQLKEIGYYPLFLGGALEHEKNIRMADAANVFYPGHFSLEEFIAIASNCDLIVTQVTMMMHIATALKKKMVLINTIFNKHEFELYGRGLIVEPPYPCECYYGNQCKKGNSCMKDIDSSTILDAVVALI